MVLKGVWIGKLDLAQSKPIEMLFGVSCIFIPHGFEKY